MGVESVFVRFAGVLTGLLLLSEAVRSLGMLLLTFRLVALLGNAPVGVAERELLLTAFLIFGVSFAFFLLLLISSSESLLSELKSLEESK